MGDAIICGYVLKHSAFQELIQGTPTMQEFVEIYGANPVQVYDRWRGSLPPEKKKKAPKLRCKPDPKDPRAAPDFLFISRYRLLHSQSQFQRLRINGYLKETEKDKSRLRDWLQFIRDDGGPVLQAEQFTFGQMVDEDPGMYNF
ncbi:hypothetical protein EST38_g14281 [Candolleomyces aberdarensis]|uniref:Uncharacterized protein n=1 Tax=Candolleomyces aberdarensis TaxID=2316362 RepID=A0A4Q2D0C7_9AGAR|nr:hypothetical protein EST38_g14281 [Candolleomyces aberdarensis]